MIDLVQMFEDAATVYNYRFAYGAKDILNYESGQIDLTSGEYVVMVFPFVETAHLANNIMNGFRANTQIWLGRKFDVTSVTGTKSNIDETEKQKYDRRLKTMRAASGSPNRMAASAEVSRIILGDPVRHTGTRRDRDKAA